MVTVLVMSVKMATPGPLKIKIFWKKGYDVILSAHDVSNAILSRDSNYNVNLVMLPKFGNSSISVREVIITSILYGFKKETLAEMFSPLNFAKFLRTPFLTEHLQWLLLSFYEKSTKSQSTYIYVAKQWLCRKMLWI